MKRTMDDLKNDFIHTMKIVCEKLNKEVNEIRRDEYVRVTVDNDIHNRLSKRDLRLLGGFSNAKKVYFDFIEYKKDQPKVLIYDIETAPMLAYVWTLWDNRIGLNQIESDWYVLSWSAKWLGEPESSIMYMDQRNEKDIENDKNILTGMWELLNEADIVITQNGKKFDQKKLNARFLLQGMKPPSSYRHIDTRSIAKKTFGFTSKKLEYMTDKLCTKHKKSKHKKFAGFSLWKECMAGNIEAWKEMEDYNRLDVLSLEELYIKMSPWDNTINFNCYYDLHKNMCKCGSVEFQESGFHYTNAAKYQKFKCVECGHETRDTTNLLNKEKRKNMRRDISPSH